MQYRAGRKTTTKKEFGRENLRGYIYHIRIPFVCVCGIQEDPETVVGYTSCFFLNDTNPQKFMVHNPPAVEVFSPIFEIKWLLVIYYHWERIHSLDGELCVRVTVSQIILSRESEVLAVECEMASVHGLLSKIPERLSYEQVIVMAQQLFEKHPPKRLARNEGLKLGTRLAALYTPLEHR